MTAKIETFDADNEDFIDELAPGTELMLGQYTIERFLAAGGFGITYLARDSLNRPIVIKECFPGGFCRRQNHSVMPRSRAHQNELKSIVRMFSQEAMSLSKAGHPNVVGVHQVFEENNTAYMALDYVEGSDLLNMLEENPESLKPALVEGYLLKVLDAIGHVHSQGILHRDISPDNIIISTSGEPILIDFGAARANSEGTASRMLSALRVVKDGYSPQEFYIAGSEQGPSCDLYSLAASFYHIITGELPPDSQTRLTSFAENAPDPYVPLAQRTKAYSKSFCTALDKAMSVLTRDRMQSAEEWVQHIQGGKGSVAKVSVAKGGSPEEKPSFMPLLLGSTALVAAAGLGLYFAFGSGESADETIASQETVVAPEAPVVSEDRAATETVTTAQAPTTPENISTEPSGELAEQPTPELGVPATPVPPALTTAAPEAAAAADPVAQTQAETLTTAAPSAVDAGPDVVVVPDAPEAPRVAQELPAVSLADNLPGRATQSPTPRPQSDAAIGAVAEPAQRAEVVTKDANVPAPTTADAKAGVDAMERVVINATWSVRLPFEPAADDMSVVGNLLFDGWGWLKEGTRIESINGMPIPGIPAIQAMLRQTTVIGDRSQLEVAIGIGKDSNGELIEHELILPVVQHVALGNGTQFQTSSRFGRWATIVTKVPDTSMTSLRQGDLLVEYMNTGDPLDGRNTLVELVQTDRRNGVTEFPLLISRDGALIEARLELYPMGDAKNAAAQADAPAVVADASPNVASLNLVEASAVLQRHVPELAFALSATEGTTIETVSADAPAWMVPGLKIVSVNGTAVATNTQLVAALNAAATAADGTAFDVRLGVDAQLSGAAVERVLTMSSQTETVLLNGLSFLTTTVDGAPETIVSAAPDGSGFQVGDKIVAYIASGERLGDGTSLKALLDRELGAGVKSFSFAIERGGQMWVEAFNLAALAP